MIRALWQSPANTVVVPIQDLCGVGKYTKMNVPGVHNGNWAFRVTRDQLDGIDFPWLRKLSQVYWRAKPVPQPVVAPEKAAEAAE